jgi:hypothetical protein
MRVVEASAVVPLSPEEVWDLLIGDQMHRLVEMPEISVVAVEDFQVRPDGTARYVVANKAGPSKTWHTADFTVYKRPHRSVNRVLDSPFGGTFYGTYESAGGGTRVHWRWEVEAQNNLQDFCCLWCTRSWHAPCSKTWMPSQRGSVPKKIRSTGRQLPRQSLALSFW